MTRKMRIADLTTWTAALTLMLGAAAFAAPVPQPAPQEARHEAAPPAEPRPEAMPDTQAPQEEAKPEMQKEEKPEMGKPEKEAKPAERNEKEQKEQNDKNNKDNMKNNKAMAQQNDRHAQPAGKGGRIPEAKFRANFGRTHTFVVNRPVIVNNRPQFQYGGYSFGLVDAWPVGWGYTDDCYIDYIDGEYFLFDLLHPGVRIALVVV